MKKTLIVTLVIGLTIFTAGCNRSVEILEVTETDNETAMKMLNGEMDGEEEPANETPEAEIEKDPEPQAEIEKDQEQEVKTFNMTARQWEFEPETITVNEGDTVVLNITSEDVAHGFAISQFGVNERLEPGQTTTVEFTADKAGTYTFFCSVFCGSGHSGMKGTLVVK